MQGELFENFLFQLVRLNIMGRIGIVLRDETCQYSCRKELNEKKSVAFQ